jgi:hypothetical protein
MMNRAIDDTSGARVATRGMLVLVALGTAVFDTGCSSTTAMRASASALAGSIWDHSRADSTPTYDLYAQNMAARVPAPAEPMLADADPARSRPKAEATADEPRPESVAAADPELRSAPTDKNVRITLGRPRSLPVLRDSKESEPAPPELMAASDPPPFAPAKPAEPPAPATAPGGEEEAPPLALAAAPRRPSASASRDPEHKLRTILDEAKRRLEALSTYQVNITRVERVGGRPQPEESVLLSVRRNPKAVRLEWPTGSSKGREVIYSTAINDKSMFVNMANSALPIPRMTIPIDSVLAMRNSRHTIAEAGFDTIFNNLQAQLVPPGETPPGGKLIYKGLQKPEQVDQSCHLIQRTTPTKEVWKVYLDAKSLMPVVVTAHQEDGELLERYTYTSLQANPDQLAAADAFDPDKRWGEAKGGLFSRIAKAAGETQAGSPTTTR